MNKIVAFLKSKSAVLCGILGLSGVALAEGETAQSPIEQIGQAVVTELNTWTTGVTDFFVDNIGTIMTVLGVAIAISLVWMVFKIFRKGANKVG